MNEFFSNCHWSAKAHDVSAVSAAFLATVTASAVNEWLQAGVLILTIIFVALGIYMRCKRIDSSV